MRFACWLPVLVAGLAMVGCSSNAPAESKGSASSAELGPDGEEIDDTEAEPAVEADESSEPEETTGDSFEETTGEEPTFDASDSEPSEATPADDISAGTGSSKSFEGTRVKAAGSINPPNPVTMCDDAKADAQSKATAAGFTGTVTWEHLSNDSDCKLSTSGGGIGYYFIFTARGTFNAN